LNGSLVKTDASVTTSEYSNDGASAGEYNLTAKAQNANGTDQYIWTWTVENEPLSITDFNPDDTTPESAAGDTVDFDVTLNQEATVRWLINGNEMENVTGSSDSYSNNTAVAGTYNVTVIASNLNGTDQQTWDWTVSNATNESLSITGFNPADTTPDSTTGNAMEFGITLNQEATIRWLIDGIEMDTETGSSGSYSNNTAVAGTYNVTAIATNVNGSDQQIWDWTVAEAENDSQEITDFSPEDDPSSVVDTYQNFTVETNQDADIEWYIDGDLEQNERFRIYRII
jgi:uncharacterized membrane protein